MPEILDNKRVSNCKGLPTPIEELSPIDYSQMELFLTACGEVLHRATVETVNHQQFQIHKTNIGKALRGKVPRSSHTEWKPFANCPEPVALPEKSNRGRMPELVPLTSPFTFLRGAASIIASDLSEIPKTGIKVQACGDCHLSNFGGYGTPERNLVFDVSDFDETMPVPWKWDVKRLVASIVVAGRYIKLPDKISWAEAIAAVQSYQDHMNEYAQMTALEVWYAHIGVESLLTFTRHPKELKKLKIEVEKARAFQPVLELHKLLDHYQVVDVAMKVVSEIHEKIGHKFKHEYSPASS